MRGQLTAFVALFSALLGTGVCTSAADDTLAVTEVARGVYVHFGVQQDWLPVNDGDVANIGFVVGTRCVAVIDSGGSPRVGERLARTIERTTKVPVCYVIDTHAHPDHVLGNIAFAKPGAMPKFVAHAKFAAALAARERYYLNAVERDFRAPMTHESIVYPSVAVEKTMELDLGERTLRLTAWPTAHTDNDLTVYDAATRTLFLSDLLFVERLPVLDGNLKGWLAVLDELSRLPVAHAIPGHGPASRDWPGALKPEQSYLQALSSETRAAIKRRMTIQQAVDQVASEAARGWLLSDQFHRRNVTAAYAELEWED